jgi:hypothetical protein
LLKDDFKKIKILKNKNDGKKKIGNEDPDNVESVATGKNGRNAYSVKKDTKFTNKFEERDYGDSQITLTYIYRKCVEDEYLRKYFYIFLIGWMSISYCFWGMVMGIVVETVNPNSSDMFHTPGFVIYSVVMCFSIPIILGNISFYFSSIKLICMSLFVFCCLSVSIDSANLYPDYERTVYFGSPEQIDKHSNQPFSRATSGLFIIVVYSLFNLITISSVPTLYRTFFLSVCKSLSKISALLAYCTHFESDSPGLNLGIIGIFSLFIFVFVDVKMKETKLLEFADTENKSKTGEKKKLSKFGFSNRTLDGRNSRANSVFTKLRNFSIRKLKKT